MFDSVEKSYSFLQSKLRDFAPPAELYLQAERVYAIEKLKKERRAIILGHNYMEPALFQTVCDFKGDSFQLARESAETNAEILVFCGVHFMAETAKILNPSKTVLIPSDKAGCSLASSITAKDVRSLKKQYPGIPVVSYVNTYAEVKAESDICFTSSNAMKVIDSLNSDTIIFLPDEFYAQNIARECGRQLIVPTLNPLALNKKEEGIERVLIGWNGRCEVHEKFTVDDIKRAREQFPDVIVLAHPECSPEVVKASDFSGSTSVMIRYVKEHSSKRYLVLTECSMADNLVAENPEKELLQICNMRCPYMAQITLEMTQKSLELNRYEVQVPEEIRIKARRALDRMLEIT